MQVARRSGHEGRGEDTRRRIGFAAGKYPAPSKCARTRRDPNAIPQLWTKPEGRLADTIAKEAEWARASVAYMRTLIPE